MTDQTTTPAMGDFDAAQLAALVAGASDEQLAEGMSDPGSRKSVLDDIFRRMSEHVNAERAGSTEAVIHWKILDRPGGGYDHYETVISGGAATCSDSPGRDPRVTFKVRPVDFLKLVSGNVAGPALFMTGKLKIEGDLMFAAQVASMFRIPQAAA